MDLSVCVIDKVNRKINFSGARNGIIVVSNGEAKRYKANSLPVGGNYTKKGIPLVRNFETQQIAINSTDWIYMYTDGFIEQVGGLENEPMSFTQFENQLINISTNQMVETKINSLQSELDNWRGLNERTDDVLIIGFQV
jgi:serine phosphatase RsbU (regulator of sigma subunit)